MLGMLPLCICEVVCLGIIFIFFLRVRGLGHTLDLKVAHFTCPEMLLAAPDLPRIVLLDQPW